MEDNNEIEELAKIIDATNMVLNELRSKMLAENLILSGYHKKQNKHDSDCTIYSALCNGRITDGICTCGYGKNAKGLQAGNLYSQERILLGLEIK